MTTHTGTNVLTADALPADPAVVIAGKPTPLRRQLWPSKVIVYRAIVLGGWIVRGPSLATARRATWREAYDHAVHLANREASRRLLRAVFETEGV